MRLYDIIEILGKIGGFIGLGTTNGLKADVSRLKEDVASLRTKFDEWNEDRSGYEVRLDKAEAGVAALLSDRRDLDLAIQSNANKIEQTAILLQALTERVAVVAKRGHDLADEMAPDHLILQLVCEKVGIKYPDRR